LSAPVWDPKVEFKIDGPSSLAAGATWLSGVFYETAPDEVLEIYKIELIPPTDTTTKTIQKIKYLTLMIGDKEYETIKINSVMTVPEIPTYPEPMVDITLGKPLLWKPITGETPAPYEATCPKVGPGESLQVKVVAEDAITQSFSIILKAARVKRAEKLLEILGGAYDASLYLDTDIYPKTVRVSLETFDELPGGLKQSKPQILPWIVYTRNSAATTPNQYYDFDYPNKAAETWMDLSWNLIEKDEAYLVNAIGVLPHANSKYLRLYIDGRTTNPDFYITTSYNEFPPALTYSTDSNAALKYTGPKPLAKPVLFHGVKGGIQILDNGTSIPANGVEIHIYGAKFILK